MSEQQVKKPDPLCEFIQGEKDCKEGLPAKVNASEAYNQGYSFQYQIGIIKSEGRVVTNDEFEAWRKSQLLASC